MKSIYQKCALGLGLATMFAAGALNATTFISEKVSIPFEFRVKNTSLPAGEYRIQSGALNDVTYLTNVKTGQSVQLLRSSGERSESKARLVFENKDGNHTLKAIW